MRLVQITPDAPKPVPAITMPTLGWAEMREKRILDFDVETVAAGFADPDWVPQKITCVAWSWIGSDTVESTVCGPEGIFGNPAARREMLEPFMAALAEADMVTGHNLLRFDLPVIQAELMRLRMPALREVVVQDTIRVARSKGFKKGQDVLGRLYRLHEQKLSLNWQDWQDAYDEPGWPTIRQRAESDVLMHKELRHKLLELDYLKRPTRWRA